MRRSLFLALLLPTAALLLAHFYLQTRSSHDPAPVSPALSPALLGSAQSRTLQETCRGKPSLDPARLDPHPINQVVFEVFPPRGPRLCHVYGGSIGALGEVRCDPEKEALQGMALVGSERGDAPLLGGLEGVFRADGELAAPTPAGRASTERLFVAASGAVAKLRDPLMGQKTGAVWRKGERTLEVDAPASAFFLAGHLVWETRGGLSARRVLGEEPGFGPELRVEVDVGLGAGHWRVCRAGARWALIAPGFSGDRAPGPSRFRVLWVDERGWSSPVEAQVEGVAGDAWTLTCSPQEARIGWDSEASMPGEYALHVVRCNAESCSQEQGRVRGGPQAVFGAPLLVPVEGGAALLWNQGASLRGKIGAVGQLQEAPERVLVEEAADLSASEVLGRGGAALVLVRPRGGAFYTYPFRVGGGRISPLECGSP